MYRTQGYLSSTIESSRRFKKLVAEPGKNSTVSAGAVELERFYRTPPFFLLALESQLSVETVWKTLVSNGHYGNPGAPRQIDAVFILNKGGLIDCGLGDGSFGLKDANGTKLKGWSMTAADTVLFDLLAWLTINMPREIRYEPILAKYLVML